VGALSFAAEAACEAGLGPSTLRLIDEAATVAGHCNGAQCTNEKQVNLLCGKPLVQLQSHGAVADPVLAVHVSTCALPALLLNIKVLCCLAERSHDAKPLSNQINKHLSNVITLALWRQTPAVVP